MKSSCPFFCRRFPRARVRDACPKPSSEQLYSNLITEPFERVNYFNYRLEALLSSDQCCRKLGLYGCYVLPWVALWTFMCFCVACLGFYWALVLSVGDPLPLYKAAKVQVGPRLVFALIG